MWKHSAPTGARLQQSASWLPVYNKARPLGYNLVYRLRQPYRAGGTSVCKPLCASLYSFAYHELRAFIFGNTCSLCSSISPSTMDLETMIHDAEIESEDETQNHWSNDRRPCTQNVTCPWMYTFTSPNQQLKNSIRIRCVDVSSTYWTFIINYIYLLWLRAGC